MSTERTKDEEGAQNVVDAWFDDDSPDENGWLHELVMEALAAARDEASIVRIACPNCYGPAEFACIMDGWYS